MLLSPTHLYLLIENGIFLAIATLFIVIVGWAWREALPYALPEPLPSWFRIWFLSVQILGGLVPLIVLLLWGVWWGHASVLTIFLPYIFMLWLQIVTESLTLRRFQTVAWVMVPYLYLPYRVWQLYEGFRFLDSNSELTWMPYLLWLEIVVWIVNYLLDLAQLPRLLRWGDSSNVPFP